MNTWSEANQRYLAAETAIVEWRVRRRLDCETDPTDPPLELRAARDAAASALAGPSALDLVAELFGLSPFERDVMMLCAGVELASSLAGLCARATGAGPSPTFSLALAALADPSWEAIAPARPLRYWRLVALTGEPALPLTLKPLRIDERVLHFLVGVSEIDERLADASVPLDPPSMPLRACLDPAMRIARMWQATPAAEAPVIQLTGRSSESLRQVVAEAARLAGLQVRQLLPGSAGDGPDLTERLWQREFLLEPMALYFDGTGAPTSPALDGFIDRVGGYLVVSGAHRRRGDRPVVHVEVAEPSGDEQLLIWQEALGDEAVTHLDGQLASVCAHYRLESSGLYAAAIEALAGAADDHRTLAERVWAAARRQARQPLEGLAQRLTRATSLDEVVLPPRERALLREVALHVRHRQRVYEQWGLGAGSARGTGVSALFAGPSGTGKTMAAEALATELALDLYRIDLASVVSKYIGETEKNLDRIFSAAERSGAILLFDEADALFGRRTEVKDSHDRYANIEVSYLLQRMESYGGLAILTTNFEEAIDPAFMRRLHFVVPFPFPDAALRERIWRGIYPASTPVGEFKFDGLARLSVTGGHIRNIAVNAAFLACDAGDPVNMSHLLTAAERECDKLKRPLLTSEVAGWV